MSESRSLLRSAGAMSAATFVSRILGLAREQAQAYYFGAGFATDAFNAAFRIPNLLRDLFAEGAMSAAFVPTFTAVREKEGSDAAWRLASRMITVLTVVLGVFTLLLLAGAPWILRVYTPGFAPDKLALARPDAIVMHPGPMNRGVEIDSRVADGAASVILPQVTFGIAVRMAVLSVAASSSRMQ